MANEDGLLAVLRVEEAQRVRCQAPGCKRTVFQSIHVVRRSGVISIYGSACFKVHFAGQTIAKERPV